MNIYYDLATNFDDNLIERVSELGVVKSIYGKLASDFVGGGRPSLVLPDISKTQLRGHIKKAHDCNMTFNYLLNASCMDNKELIAPSHRRIMKLVKEIKEQGADEVTVSSPALLKMIKEQFPDLRISTSIYMNTDSLDKIKHFESMGASQITLSHNFTRNFPLLRKALKISDKDTELRVIANNVCLHNCPYMVPSHCNLLSHSSQTKHVSKGFLIDEYTLFCGLQKIKNPEEILMSDWIRPEDVHHYRELCEITGKENLSLKLTDRARTTDWLVNVVEAYAKESYEGNLMDILNYIGNKGGYAQVRKWTMIKGSLTGKAKPKELLGLEKATFLPEIFIDNKSLDGFLEHFINNPCEKKTCYTLDKSYGGCRVCHEKARQIVQIDKDKRHESIERIEKLLHSINSGEMFGIKK